MSTSNANKGCYADLFDLLSEHEGDLLLKRGTRGGLKLLVCQKGRLLHETVVTQKETFDDAAARAVNALRRKGIKF